MTALQEKWAEMSWYRRILLVVMSTEILLFFIATLVTINRPGLAYRDGLLYPRTEGRDQIYEGTVDGERARFTVSPEGEISYQWGEYAYGPYQITQDPSAAPEGKDHMAGLEISLEDEVLFRGGYLPGSVLTLYQENGEPLWDIGVSATATDGVVIIQNGRVIPPEELHEPSLAALARVVLNPELTHRGDVGLYLLVTLFALFNIVQICFPGLMFRLSLWGHVRNLDDAEPSDFYIFAEHIEWAVLAIACLALYLAAIYA